MPKAVFIVQMNAIEPEREDEFNRWYNQVHLADVLKVDGYVAATRYELQDIELFEGLERPTRKYMAIYEMETDDIAAAGARLRDAFLTGQMEIIDAIDFAGTLAGFYQAITARVLPETSAAVSSR